MIVEDLQDKHLPNVLSLLPGILICDVSSKQGTKTTETVLQTSRSIEIATTTHLIMLILVITLTLIVMLIVIYMTCVHKKPSRSSRKKGRCKSNGGDSDQHLRAEEILAKVHQFRREKVQLVERIEKGEYGAYWKAIVTGAVGDPSTEMQVMAKEAVEQYDQQMLLKELTSYVRVGHHVNVLNLLGVVTEHMKQGELFLITEFCRFGNLKDFLVQNRYAFRDDSIEQLFAYDSSIATLSTFGVSQSFTKLDLLGWTYQIACGLQYLASRAFFYGNLSAHDVLLGDGNIVKLANFAVPRRLNSSTKLTQKNVQSLERMAPECLQDEGKFTASSDVWSYGVLLWELFSLGSDPCWDMVTHRRLMDSFESGSRLPKPEYADDEVYQIMRCCWHRDPLERPSFTELCFKLFCMIPSQHLRHYEELRNIYCCINAVDSAVLKQD
ncbi:vascular endothelial growth factor receptor 1-like [Anopheles maculipalpis]|uniref:vascular endothelial growth factor receptor 1-like n=1 Tax=Anopheles maculipalpis TaxID=1496333 RepID=UPI00215928D1|nr:vascular endothelial growth factor receptor 1-like [Anopheles maculipalpis]